MGNPTRSKIAIFQLTPVPRLQSDQTLAGDDDALYTIKSNPHKYL